MFKKTISIYIAVFALSFSLNGFAEDFNEVVLGLSKSTNNTEQRTVIDASKRFATIGGSKEAARHLMTVLGESIAPPDPTGDLNSPESREIVKNRISAARIRSEALRSLLVIMGENKDLVTEVDLERLRRTAQYDFGDENRGYAATGYALLEPNLQKAREFLRQVQSSDGEKVFSGEYTLSDGVQSEVRTGFNSKGEPLYNISWRIWGEKGGRLGSKGLQLSGTRAEIKQQVLEQMDLSIVDLKSRAEKLVKHSPTRYQAILDRVAELESQRKKFAENEAIIPYGDGHKCFVSLSRDQLVNKVKIEDMIENRSRARYMSENLEGARQISVRTAVKERLHPFLSTEERAEKAKNESANFYRRRSRDLAERCSVSVHDELVGSAQAAVSTSPQPTSGTVN